MENFSSVNNKVLIFVSGTIQRCELPSAMIHGPILSFTAQELLMAWRARHRFLWCGHKIFGGAPASSLLHINWAEAHLCSIPVHSPEFTRSKRLLPEWFRTKLFYSKTWARSHLPENTFPGVSNTLFIFFGYNRIRAKVFG